MVLSLEPKDKEKEHGFLETYGLPIWTFPLTILFVILFAVCVEWDSTFAKDDITKHNTFTADKSGLNIYFTREVQAQTEGGLKNYTMYMNTAVMCVIGFGFLYVFSKFYIWGGVGFNFFICGLGFLWTYIAISLVESMFDGKFHKVAVNIDNMMLSADITAAVLISFGAFYGFTSPSQIVLITMVEIFMVVVNEHIVLKFLHVYDQGGSMLIHAFGAYFGVATVFGMGLKKEHLPDRHRTTTYFSDMGAMLGTVVLWVYWPSFNAASLYDDTHIQGRVIGNTYLSIMASCVTAFATSALIHRGKFEMIEIQNGTLAGGVIIGTISPFLIDPWAPVLIGAIGGVISTFGYGLLHPYLEDCGILDSAGVQMLHGIPGILGGLFAALATLADNTNYMFSYNTTWTNTTDVDRDRGQQFGYHLGAILVSLGIAVVSGLITGVLVRLPICPTIEKEDMLIDHDFWVIHDKNHDPRLKKDKKSNIYANQMAEAKA